MRRVHRIEAAGISAASAAGRHPRNDHDAVIYSRSEISIERQTQHGRRAAAMIASALPTDAPYLASDLLPR